LKGVEVSAYASPDGAYTLNSSLPQGLGTGQLYHNNIPSPLEIRDAQLFYQAENNWDLSAILK